MLRFFVIVLFAFAFSFGMWYIIFAFVSGEWNPLNWHWIARLAYLWIGLSATSAVSKTLLDEFL